MNDDVIGAVELVARAVNGADNEWANMPKTDEHEPWDTYVARVVLAVPAVAEVFARDAKVREIVAKWAHLRNEPWPLTVALEVADSTAALFDGGDRP